MTIGELVKNETRANADGRADKPDDSGDCREKLALLRDEENHVGAESQLRHLERHRNDHAHDLATNHNRCPDFAQTRRYPFAFEPFKRTKREYRRFHWACTDRAHMIRATFASRGSRPGWSAERVG